jgi:hypothetical protein
LSKDANIRTKSDGYWQYFVAPERPPYEITGKYLFFSEDRDLLVRIAIDEITTGGFHIAKTHLPGRNLNPEYALCLYYRDDSRKRDLASRYKGRQGLKYRYWKSDASTHSGEYSQEFLGQLSEPMQRRFTRKRPG